MSTERRPIPSRVVVVIPTYDEAENVATVLNQVHAAAPDAHVLVVDDLSPDGTGEIVRAYAAGRVDTFLLTRRSKDGLGSAYRAGFRWALEHGYDVIVQMDADLSHPPRRVPALVAALAGADIAVGSRYVSGGSTEDWTWSRRVVSRLGNAYVRLVLGLPVRDATAGFRAWRRQALLDAGALETTSNGYCFQIENTWRACRRGLTIAELPISFVDRGHGTSKMTTSIAVEAVLQVLGWRLGELRRRLPARSASREHVAAP